MDRNDEVSFSQLLQIGEVAKACDVDRRTILYYESKGLFQPTAQKENTGYRYYSAEAVTDLIRILQLRSAGLSLEEIKAFERCGSSDSEELLAEMERKIAALLWSLEEMRSAAVKKQDYSVSYTFLPAMSCLTRVFSHCRDVKDAAEKMQETLLYALKKGFHLSREYALFAEYPWQPREKPRLTDFSLRVCVPLSQVIDHENCMLFPAVSGISLCYRGDEEGLCKAYEVLGQFAEDHSLEAAGDLRESYRKPKGDAQEKEDPWMIRMILPIKKRKTQR